MSVPHLPQSGRVEFEKKLQQHKPERQMALTILGTITLLIAIGLALLVALKPNMSLYPAIRSLFSQGS